MLDKPLDLPRWWPAVYLQVTEPEPGVFTLLTKGWLPYTLRWSFRVVDRDYPRGFTLEAWGDFEGRGIWTFEQEDESTNVIYDWHIRADKPLLRYLSFLFKAIFFGEPSLGDGPRGGKPQNGIGAARSKRQRAATRFFFRIRQIERFAMLTAVNFRICTELLFHFVAKEVPAFQMTSAEFAFLVLLVAGAHARDAALHLGSIAEGGD